MSRPTLVYAGKGYTTAAVGWNLVPVPGARADDTILIAMSAFGATGTVLFDTGWSVSGVGATTTISGPTLAYESADYDVVEQFIVLRLSEDASYIYIVRDEVLEASAPVVLAAVAVIRGALDPIVNPTTWFSSSVSETYDDPWVTGIVYDDAAVTVDDDELIVSLLNVVSPLDRYGGLAMTGETPGATLTSSSSYLGSGELGGFAVVYGGDAGSTLDYTLNATIEGEDPPLAAFIHGYTFYMAAAPAPIPPYPSVPSPQRLYLTCPESYSVWITDATYENRLDVVEASSIQWSRVLDEYSTTTVTCPDELGGVYCVAKLGGLVPWKFGVIIERDDIEVWKGAVRSVTRQSSGADGGRAIQIQAVDILGRYEKLPLIYNGPYEYENVDSGTVFRDIIVTHSSSSANAWTLRVPTFYSDVTMSRTLRPSDNQHAYELLKELMDASVDVSVVNGLLYCFDPDFGWLYSPRDRDDIVPGPYNAANDLVYGLFTAESYSELPGWSIAGQNQGNYVTVSASGVGELGFAKIYQAQDTVSQEFYGGVLMLRDQMSVQRADDDQPVSEDETMHRRANSLLALHTNEPAVISGGTLAEGAPVDIPNLIPGSIWNVDIHDAGYGQLLQQGRLKRVDVSVTIGGDGVVEKVNPTIQPVGYDNLTEDV